MDLSLPFCHDLGEGQLSNWLGDSVSCFVRPVDQTFCLCLLSWILASAACEPRDAVWCRDAVLSVLVWDWRFDWILAWFAFFSHLHGHPGRLRWFSNLIRSECNLTHYWFIVQSCCSHKLSHWSNLVPVHHLYWSSITVLETGVLLVMFLFCQMSRGLWLAHHSIARCEPTCDWPLGGCSSVLCRQVAVRNRIPSSVRWSGSRICTSA